MRSYLFTILLTATLTNMAMADQAPEKPTLRWLVWELSPEFIPHGPLKGQGYADKFLAFFIAGLPDYKHEVVWTNVNRWNVESQRPQHCTPHVWGDFFKSTTLLSRPYTYTAPHRLIAHQRMQPRLGEPGSLLSLQALLQDPSLRLLTVPIYIGQNEEHSRYPVLSPYLKPYIGKPNLVQYEGSKNEINLQLLKRGRADYTLGYPNTITSQKRIQNLPDEFISYRLKEHNLYKQIYVSCLDTPFGRKVIEQVNQMLTQKTLLTFLSYQEEWNAADPFFRKVTLDHLIHGRPLPNVVP